VPGSVPGRRREYIDKILTRITLAAIYVSVICVLPSILIARFNVPFYFGGQAPDRGGVAMDTSSRSSPT